jgi:hypothetical protein
VKPWDRLQTQMDWEEVFAWGYEVLAVSHVKMLKKGSRVEWGSRGIFWSCCELKKSWSPAARCTDISRL